MEPVSIEQALQYCLENPDNLSTGQLLSKFPEYREELEPLLAFDTQLKIALPHEMPPESKALVKQRLVNRVAAHREDHASEKEAPSVQPLAGEAKIKTTPWWRRKAFAAVVAVLVLGVLWWQAATSLPDNPLYPMKLTTEDLFLNLAGNSKDLIRGHLDLGNTRLVDIRLMQSLGAQSRVGAAVDNYRYHIGSCLHLWQATPDDKDIDLAKVIYASSVAGQRILTTLDGGNSLPGELNATLQDANTTIDTLQSSSAKILRDADIELDPVLKDVGGTLGSLLAQAPGVTPTVTAVAAPTITMTPGTSTPTITPTVTQGLPSPEPPSSPTLTAVFQAAQTVIAEAGPARTRLAAAETVLAGGAGTPMSTPLANAIQTMLAQPTLIVTVRPQLTPSPLGTATLIVELKPTVTAVRATSLPATAVRALSTTPVVKTVLPSPTVPLPKPLQP